MKNLRRFNLSNRDYFITLVTYLRKPILTKDIGLFWNSWDTIKPIAWAILPNHIHLLINPGRINISNIIHDFKIKYSRGYRDEFGSGRVWHNRFWDHVIRNQDDMNHHIDYIHYNPVKHGLVKRPFDWENSSIHEFEEYYQEDWGVDEELNFGGEFGE